MGKVDKEKLLKEISKHYGSTGGYYGVIKNFPEEPEIDFDALFKEFNITKCVGHGCNTCEYESSSDDPGSCFADFLKSKHLTAQERVEQKTICAVCGETKQTPLRRDDMGGYVCLSCIDAELTNRSVQKPKQIPVKKCWTLKQQYIDYVNKEFKHVELQTMYVTEPKHPEFYDLHEEPDYSKIPKGSIVEIEFVSGIGNKCGYVNGITNKSISVGFHMLYSSGNSTTINFDQIESIVILKLAKE